MSAPPAPCQPAGASSRGGLLQAVSLDRLAACRSLTTVRKLSKSRVSRHVRFASIFGPRHAQPRGPLILRLCCKTRVCLDAELRFVLWRSVGSGGSAVSVFLWVFSMPLPEGVGHRRAAWRAA